jgi:hypothetical protein
LGRAENAKKGWGERWVEVAGGYIYMFDVASSDHSPHQFDNVYYMRLDGQTLPAPHAYVEALFKKIRYPAIEGYLTPPIAYGEDNRDPTLHFHIVFRNQTPLINEENLYCRIFVTGGILVFDRPNEYGREMTQKNITDVVSYGNTIDAFFTVMADESSLKIADHTLSISIWFGGKYSPVRYCEYKFDLHPPLPLNLKNVMMLIVENEYLHERHEKKAEKETHEEFLSRIGR